MYVRFIAGCNPVMQLHIDVKIRKRPVDSNGIMNNYFGRHFTPRLKILAAEFRIPRRIATTDWQSIKIILTQLFKDMAEGVGFEPTVAFRRHTLSRRAH